jgi:hypothetical protein
MDMYIYIYISVGMLHIQVDTQLGTDGLEISRETNDMCAVCVLRSP